MYDPDRVEDKVGICAFYKRIMPLALGGNNYSSLIIIYPGL